MELNKDNLLIQKKMDEISFLNAIRYGKKPVALSLLFMGLGQAYYKQWAKAAIYFLIEIIAILFIVFFASSSIHDFFTLGTVQGNAWLGIGGDDSIIMLILGILSFIGIAVFIAAYINNVKDSYSTQIRIQYGKKKIGFFEGLSAFLDKKFYKTVLFLPIISVAIFCVLPIIFMMLIAFTNYGGDIVPPKLVDWTMFESFIKVFSLSGIAPTFFKIITWNIIWAILATALNYFGGLFVALLLNKKCIKGKAFWRSFPILAYAIPGFITMIGFKFMFSNGGPINYYIRLLGGDYVNFLGVGATMSSRLIGLFVNAWLSIPTTMLLATGILSNINNDLYEAAKIDGANAFRQFKSITLPFVLFATTPALLGQFIGNFNNFGIFYFLRGGLLTEGYFLASDTDLLINWLYRLSIDNNYYAIGAAISIIIFIFTSIISLIVYTSSPSYKTEDTFR